MPFQEIYRVNFSFGNLRPAINVLEWPDMVHSEQVPGSTESLSDNEGINLSIARGVSDHTAPVRNSVYVDLVGPHRTSASLPRWSIPADVRLITRVAFDLPVAVPLPAPPVHAPVTRPEPWAVGLNVSLDHDVSTTAHEVNVTCQFTNQPSGVRLNTPGDLQHDQSSVLEGPLNYARYQRNGSAFPPLFFLEQSFCGWNALANRQNPGNGALRILHDVPAPLDLDEVLGDQRAFSHNVLTPRPPAAGEVAPKIGSLGVSLITQQGHGRMGVRLKWFSVWMNGIPSSGSFSQ